MPVALTLAKLPECPRQPFAEGLAAARELAGLAASQATPAAELPVPHRSLPYIGLKSSGQVVQRRDTARGSAAQAEHRLTSVAVCAHGRRKDHSV
jgi:hypothetical protein